MTPAELRAISPEFSKAPEAAIAEAIATAQAECHPSVFGAQLETAVRLYACHILATSPYGQQARLVSKTGSSTYLTQWEDLLRGATLPTVAGY